MAVLPPPQITQAVWDFATRANDLLSFWPEARVTSWWRNPQRNREVGGHPRSRHLLGLAFDAVLPRGLIGDYLADVRTVGLRGLDEGDHVHVQDR